MSLIWKTLSVVRAEPFAEALTIHSAANPQERQPEAAWTKGTPERTQQQPTPPPPAPKPYIKHIR